MHHLDATTKKLEGSGKSEVQTRLARFGALLSHPDCFLVLGICSLLLLLGSMVALASAPAACTVFERQQMALHGLARGSAGNRGPGPEHSNGRPSIGHPPCLGTTSSSRSSKQHYADSLPVQGMLHACRLSADLTAPSNTESL